jgi:hypothetical protein
MVNQRGGNEWELIKILVEGDRGSNKMNTASKTRLRLNYPSWSRPRSHWSATDPRNQQKTSKPKLTNMHNGNLRGLLLVLHRPDRCPAPVRRVTPVRPVDRAGQAGGYSSHTTNVLESLNDFSRPWNRNTPKTQPARQKKPSQNQAKHLQTRQELASINTT